MSGARPPADFYVPQPAARLDIAVIRRPDVITSTNPLVQYPTEIPVSGSPQAICPPAPPCPNARGDATRPKPRMNALPSSPPTTTLSARFTGSPKIASL